MQIIFSVRWKCRVNGFVSSKVVCKTKTRGKCHSHSLSCQTGRTFTMCFSRFYECKSFKIPISGVAVTRVLYCNDGQVYAEIHKTCLSSKFVVRPVIGKY